MYQQFVVFFLIIKKKQEYLQSEAPKSITGTDVLRNNYKYKAETNT